MKKILSIVIVLVMFGMALNAQVMKKGDKVIMAGLGFPDSDGFDITLPPVIGIFDYGFSDKLGIGYISGGGLLSYARFNNDFFNRNFQSETKLGVLHLMVRSAYHFDFVDITGNKVFDKFDIYAGLGLGWEIVTTKITSINGNSSDTDPKFKADIFIGGKYTLNDKVSLYTEIGAEVAFISGGVCIKL